MFGKERSTKEYDRWCKIAKRENSIFIIKPSAQSCGQGIRLIHNGNYGSVPKDKPCIIQRYITHPYLINGKKFDLRLYVLVTGFDPLKIYLFREGLVRFSSYKYSMKNLNCRYVHLTNYAINKKCKYFNEDSKWNLTSFWRHFEICEGKENTRRCQEKVKDIIVKSLVAAEEEITPTANRIIKVPGRCYELFGFDIMIDSCLKPWLVEVNISLKILDRDHPT